MPLCLSTLPYELLSYIVAGLDLEDVVSLARTCAHFQYLERENSICRGILEARLPFSAEVAVAREGQVSWASVLRRIVKQRDSFATATPFSVSIIAFSDTYTYNEGVLAYTLDDKLRILKLYNATRYEVVVSLPELLQQVVAESDQRHGARFRILNIQDDIVACLYTTPEPVSVKWLIIIDIYESKILLIHELPMTDKIFVRHDRGYLYYGRYGEFGHDGCKCWALQGYQFENQGQGLKALWFPEKIYLRDLIGSDIDHTICFRIYAGYFYAVSNQTTREVEEVDWTSCYHAFRFPVESPNMLLLERSQDEFMWRRQHAEGPIDDRWTSLRLDVDKATGRLNIIETRNEWIGGSSKSRRTFYTKEVVFKQKSMDEILHTAIVSSTKSSSMVSSLLNATTTSVAASPTAISATSMLAALTRDRLALTLTPNDNPHYLPPQTRIPRDYHTTEATPFVFSKIHLSHYNPHANSYLDLVNDPCPSSPLVQRLRLHVGSRKRKPPARVETGDRLHPEWDLLVPESADPLTGELKEGLNDRFTDNAISSWPPKAASDQVPDERWEDLNSLLNPSSHLGNIQAAGDERCLVYATGGKGQPRAIVLVSFDPAIRLEGLKKWNPSRTMARSTPVYDFDERGAVDHHMEINTSQKEEANQEISTADTKRSAADLPHQEDAAADGYESSRPSWIWTEEPMYKAINRGYDFSL